MLSFLAPVTLEPLLPLFNYRCLLFYPEDWQHTMWSKPEGPTRVQQAICITEQQLCYVTQDFLCKRQERILPCPTQPICVSDYSWTTVMVICEDGSMYFVVLETPVTVVSVLKLADSFDFSNETHLCYLRMVPTFQQLLLTN